MPPSEGGLGAEIMGPYIVIAVDGTAASGKGTLAKRLARISVSPIWIPDRSTGWSRSVCWKRAAIPTNETDAVKAAQSHRPNARAPIPPSAPPRSATSPPSSRPFPPCAPRCWSSSALSPRRRRFRAPGAVIDGRDIGTVICPDATAKLFVDARPEIRAHRRWLELQAAGQPREESAILAEIVARDARDRTRAVAPLKPATDARLLDTSDLDIDAAFAAALALVKPGVENALKARPGG